MLLTGQADMDDAIAVVNQGQIFRFLTKPCPPEIFGQALNDALEQYRLILAEKELLEKTLRGSIKLLTDIVSIISPDLFSRSTRTRSIAARIAKNLALKNLWKIEIAALLSQIGCITAPSEILEKKYRGHPLTKDENEILAKHLQTGRELLANIPRLEEIGEAIAYQDKNYDGSGFPAIDKKGGDIPFIARILKVALDFDNYLIIGKSEPEAIDEMQKNRHRYDPEILSALHAEVKNIKNVFTIREISVDEIKAGMILAEDLKTKTNLLLVAKRQEVSETMRICIANFAANKNIHAPIKIMEYAQASE
jgi:response regulator RpfG family c-di-GMP phosphodiesterase